MVLDKIKKIPVEVFDWLKFYFGYGSFKEYLTYDITGGSGMRNYKLVLYTLLMLAVGGLIGVASMDIEQFISITGGVFVFFLIFDYILFLFFRRMGRR